MEVHYSNLKLGYDDLCDACDDIVAFANSSSSKLRDVIIYASKKDPHSSCVLENVKTNLINMLNEIYSQLLGPTKKILDMMTEDLEENTGFSGSTAFDFDYENNFIIKMTKSYENLINKGYSEDVAFKYIQNKYSVAESTCEEIKKNYIYSNKFGEIDNYLKLNLPSIEVFNSRVGGSDNFLNNYRRDLIGDIKTRDYYRKKCENENFTIDGDLLNKKIEALKKAYNLSDDDVNKLFAIVTREDVPLWDHTRGEIYYEAANVMSSALNRANSGKYYNVYDEKGDPIKQLFASNQYEGALYKNYSPYLDKAPDEVKDAVCDVLLSGIPSHDRDSFHGAGYVDGIPNKVTYVNGGNNYFNL